MSLSRHRIQSVPGAAAGTWNRYSGFQATVEFLF